MPQRLDWIDARRAAGGQVRRERRGSEQRARRDNQRAGHPAGQVGDQPGRDAAAPERQRSVTSNVSGETAIRSEKTWLRSR